MLEKVLEELYFWFPGSKLNSQGEFIAHVPGNSYFCFSNCDNELEVKCKVLEWLSRDACKTCPFHNQYKNDEFNSFIREGINGFLRTNFSKEDMLKIYRYLGNQINRNKTIKFIASRYDLKVLEETV